MKSPYALVLYISGILFVLIPDSIQAQQRCGAVQYEQMIHSDLSKQQREDKLEQWIRNNINTKVKTFQTEGTQSTYTVPVVVHIIHNGEPIGAGTNLSTAQIKSQIQVLNDDYNRTNADAIQTPGVFIPFVGSLSLQFVLAKQDPDGNPTNGITRTKGTRTSWALSNDSELKALSYWPAENYLNIWVADMSNDPDHLVGYAQLPVSNLPGLENSPNDRLTDGVVIHYRAFGSGQGYDLVTSFNKGRTATHEVGHFFGLRHIWGDGNCATDYVDDTPFQATATSSTTTNVCPTHPQPSCDVPSKPYKMFQNYMDYTNDMCMNLFTNNQSARMTVVLTNSPRRASLLSSPGATPSPNGVNDLAITGVASPSLVHCVASPTIKINIKNSSSLDVESFQVQRVLNGGTPSTYNFTGVLIEVGDEKQFELTNVNLQPGKNQVRLTVLNPNGDSDNVPSNDTFSFNTYFDQSQDVAPLRVSFDNPSEIPWIIASPINSDPWEFVNTTKGQSLVYKNFNNVTPGEESWIVSPVLDLSRYSENSFFYDLSYARRPGHDDRLKIVASEDCGLTYPTILFEGAGSELTTIESSIPWVPSANSDWTRQYLNITELSGKKNIRLALIATNQNGNNLYIDNLEIFTSQSSIPIIPENNFKLYYPTLSQSDLAISFNLPDRKDVRLQVFSILGQIVIDNILPNTLNQTYYFDLGMQSQGIYIFKLQIDQQVTATKVFIAH